MNKSIEFTVPIKKYGQLILFFGVITVIFGGIILYTLIKAITNFEFNFHEEFFGYLIFFPFFLMYSMWLVFGYEKLIIKEHSIELIKSNLIYTTKKSFAIDEIQSIEVVEKRFKSDKWIDVRRERIREKRRAFPFWIRMGRLRVKTKHGSRTFFNGLFDTEVQAMKEKIERELGKRS